MKTKIHAFRLQHKDSKLGIFIHDESTFPRKSKDSKYIYGILNLVILELRK